MLVLVTLNGLIGANSQMLCRFGYTVDLTATTQIVEATTGPDMIVAETTVDVTATDMEATDMARITGMTGG